MEIKNRNRVGGYGRTISFSPKTVDIKFDIHILNYFCALVLSDNKFIRKSHLFNLRNLVAVLNKDLYQNDMELKMRLNFLEKLLEGKLVNHISDKRLLITYANGGLDAPDIIDINNFVELSKDEIKYLNETIASTLKYTFIYNDIDIMLDICTRFKAADYINKAEIVKEYEQFIYQQVSKFRKVKADSTDIDTFSLDPNSLVDTMRDIYNTLTNPSRRLITGMQGINASVGGGFEAERVYLYAGIAGIGKSMCLLNFAYQMKKYNKSYVCKDPTKRPAIVYLTQENDVKETVSRLISIITNERIHNLSFDDLMYRLKTEGELYLSDDSPIDLIIKFVPNRSVDTSYLYTLTEDLEDEGIEVIALLQDHIKRIRSSEYIQDTRLELGNVINEFKVFAQLKQIPVITITHLNRAAAATIEDAVTNNKADITRLLGKANIGESMLMIDNTDYGFIIHEEYDQNGNKYVTFKNIKKRDIASLDYVCIPTAPGNDIRYMEDLYAIEPLYKTTLKPDAPVVNNNIKTNIYNNISILDGDEDDNAFASASVYSSTTTFKPKEMTKVVSFNKELIRDIA